MSSASLLRIGKTIYEVAKFNITIPPILRQTKPAPLGRWIVNDNNWEIRAEYATSDSCGGNLCSKYPLPLKK